MTDVQILQNLSELLGTDNMFIDFIRDMGWRLIMFLKKLLDIIDSVVHNTYKLINFLSSNIVENNIGVLSGIIVAILAISIAILGYKIIFKRDNKSNAFTGSLLVIVVVMALPIIFSQGIKILENMTNSISISTEVTGGMLSDKIIKSNLHDLMKYAEYDNFQLPSSQITYNDVPASMIKHIDLSEVLDDSKINNSNNKGVVNKQLDFDKNGNLIAKKFDKNVFIGKDGYYRYYINWFAIIANFIIVGITLLLMGVKTVKIVFNLALDRIVGTILIFTDIEDGKRAKELLTHILTTFAVLMVSVFSMNLYAEFTGWVQTQQLGDGWVGIMTNIVILLGISIALLEGPTIIQKLVGTQVDSGLGRTAAGIFGMSKMTKDIVGTGVNTVKTATSFGKSAINFSNKSGLTNVAVKGGMKVADVYGEAVQKYNPANQQSESMKDNESDSAGINYGDELNTGKVNSSNNNDSVKANDSNISTNKMDLPNYSRIDEAMNQSGFKAVDDKSQQIEDSKNDNSFELDNNLNNYKPNVSSEVDFNDALNIYDKEHSDKRNKLNNSRRQSRNSRLNLNGKHQLNSDKSKKDVIPRNFTKGENK